jgi:hypothetical protein
MYVVMRLDEGEKQPDPLLDLSLVAAVRVSLTAMLSSLSITGKLIP